MFWYRLLRQLGQRPTALAAVRAYYIGHLGKYLPGKACALLLRATLSAWRREREFLQADRAEEYNQLMEKLDRSA